MARARGAVSLLLARYPHGDTAMNTPDVLLDNARAALAREGQLLDVVAALSDHCKRQDAEIAELREDVAGLSNRIESWGRVIQSRTDHLA